MEFYGYIMVGTSDQSVPAMAGDSISSNTTFFYAVHRRTSKDTSAKSIITVFFPEDRATLTTLNLSMNHNFPRFPLFMKVKSLLLMSETP